MARAQRRPHRPIVQDRSSADPREIEKFSARADDWWNPDGAFAPLHRLNPLRLAFIRETAVRHFRRDARALRSFTELTLIDIGCGGGLLSEPLGRQGFEVLGIDAAQENVEAAAGHARKTDARVKYRCALAEDIAGEDSSFDVVLAMEIVEHVPDRRQFLESCATLLEPGGLLFVATIARTVKALALAKFGAEYLLNWIPPGTHDWNKFVSPYELSNELEATGLSVLELQGVSFDPLGWRWRLSSDMDVNYMAAAAKPRRRASVKRSRVKR